MEIVQDKIRIRTLTNDDFPLMVVEIKNIH